jgi:hypothetical protein
MPIQLTRTLAWMQTGRYLPCYRKQHRQHETWNTLEWQQTHSEEHYRIKLKRKLSNEIKITFEISLEIKKDNQDFNVSW